MNQPSKNKRPIIFTVIGIVNTLIDYIIYSVLVLLIFRNTDQLVTAGTISALITTIFAYILHHSFTWRDRKASSFTVAKFLLANALMALVARPAMVFIFSKFTPLYQLAFDISLALHLPVSQDFVISTGVFAFITIATLIINYFVYSRLVFNEELSPKRPKSRSK